MRPSTASTAPAGAGILFGTLRWLTPPANLQCPSRGTNPPTHQPTDPPTHRLTVSPSHRLTVSPSHRLTVSPSHRLTVSSTATPFPPTARGWSDHGGPTPGPPRERFPTPKAVASGPTVGWRGTQNRGHTEATRFGVGIHRTFPRGSRSQVAATPGSTREPRCGWRARAPDVTAPLRPPTSDLRPPTSNLQPPTSNLQPPTSNLRPPTSDLRPPTSDLRPPTPDP
jgi:hypothetical protein